MDTAVDIVIAVAVGLAVIGAVGLMAWGVWIWDQILGDDDEGSDYAGD